MEAKTPKEDTFFEILISAVPAFIMVMLVVIFFCSLVVALGAGLMGYSDLGLYSLGIFILDSGCLAGISFYTENSEGAITTSNKLVLVLKSIFAGIGVMLGISIIISLFICLTL